MLARVVEQRLSFKTRETRFGVMTHWPSAGRVSDFRGGIRTLRVGDAAGSWESGAGVSGARLARDAASTLVAMSWWSWISAVALPGKDSRIRLAYGRGEMFSNMCVPVLAGLLSCRRNAGSPASRGKLFVTSGHRTTFDIPEG
jgi:hypothetical protein